MKTLIESVSIPPEEAVHLVDALSAMSDVWNTAEEIGMVAKIPKERHCRCCGARIVRIAGTRRWVHDE